MTVVVRIVLLLLLIVEVSCYLPRHIHTVSRKSPMICMNIFNDFIKIEQDKVSLRIKELELQEKKMNQDKQINIAKLVINVFAILAFLVFSVQLKDGLLGQATSFNSHLISLSDSVFSLKVKIYRGLVAITSIAIIKHLYNALRYVYNIILDRIFKWSLRNKVE
jgi:hypothetical protein